MIKSDERNDKQFYVVRECIYWYTFYFFWSQSFLTMRYILIIETLVFICLVCCILDHL